MDSDFPHTYKSSEIIDEVLKALRSSLYCSVKKNLKDNPDYKPEIVCSSLFFITFAVPETEYPMLREWRNGRRASFRS